MGAFWAEFIFGGSGQAITAHGSLDPIKQEIQIQIQIQMKCAANTRVIYRCYSELERDGR
jgi:hypothetical protein